MHTYRPLYSRRRCSVGVLQTLSHGSLPSTNPSPSDSTHITREMGEEMNGGTLCTDTAEASYKNKYIAKEMSDMVYYTEPIKFNGFKVSN